MRADETSASHIEVRPGPRSPDGDDCVDRVLQHHRTMVAQLTLLVGNLTDAAGHAGDRSAVRTLSMWCNDVLLAHADAVENHLFEPARTLADEAFHVGRLRVDHARLHRLVGQIESADDTATAVLAAQELLTLFTEHVGREQVHLVVALGASPVHDLGSLVEGSGALTLDVHRI